MNRPVELTKEIDKLKEIGLEFSNNGPIDELNALSDKIDQSKFYLVVIGLFKRGKSTFINALVGKEIAPTAVVPLTSVITILEHGKDKYAEVIFMDKRTKRIGSDEIINFIAEEENPNNQKNVAYVIIFTDSEILSRITIIDTPGVGSSLEHNTDTTYGFINKIDAAIFLLSADIPITKLEIEFIHKLKQTVPKIFFILNKIDLLNDAEIDQVKNFSKKVIKEIYNDEDFKIMTVSSKRASEGIKENNNELINESNIREI